MSALRELFSEAWDANGIHGDVLLEQPNPTGPKPDPYAQKFARDLRTGKLPNLSQLEDPEATIAEADRVLAESTRLSKMA